VTLDITEAKAVLYSEWAISTMVAVTESYFWDGHVAHRFRTWLKHWPNKLNEKSSSSITRKKLNQQELVPEGQDTKVPKTLVNYYFMRDYQLRYLPEPEV